ncbi:MAG: CBS domain-containing protein [Planctomycetia bacterium]|nr:CBS domain-containing protein [Planctomycetia bacterium]
MVICPLCQAENIDGADECEQCQQPLGYLSRPRASSPLERSILKDRVFSLGPRTPLSVDAATPVAEVLRLMVDESVGCVVITRDDDMVGIFTERDALMRLNVDAADHAERPIRDFMTGSPETIELDAPIAFALHKMDVGGYRHIPVMNEGKVTGVISVRDILRHITEGLMSRKA